MYTNAILSILSLRMHIVSDSLNHVHILYHDRNVNVFSKSDARNASPSELFVKNDSSSSLSNDVAHSSGNSSSPVSGTGDVFDAVIGVVEAFAVEEVEDEEQDFSAALCARTRGPNLLFRFFEA